VVRTVRVLTNETCDHRCSFCDTRRAHERASVAGHAQLRARIEAARGAAEIVLTGGEPTLRRDLPALIAAAAQTGARVILESNGASWPPARARELARAGLAVARLHVPGVVQHAATTGDIGGWVRLVALAHALHEAGVGIEAVVPIVAASMPELDSIAAAIHDALPMIATIRARVPSEAPDASALASPADAVAGFERLAEGVRGCGLALQLDPATFLPPCLLARPDRHAHAFALGPGGAHRDALVRIPACEGCIVRDRCPGVPRAWESHALGHARALHDDGLRRRLSIVRSVAAQIDRELVTDELWRRTDGATVPARIVRIGFRCNQACRFCFVSTHLPAPPRAAVEAAIVDIAERGGVLVLSGGEPTLDRELEHWIALGKTRGAREVELQTNATRLDPMRVAALVQAGLDTAFVSLHGASAAISDAVTDTAGTFVQTLAGLDALLEAGVRTRINFVLCTRNLHELPAFVELVAARWPAAAITVSFVAASTDLVPRTAELVPRYADVMPALVEALARAAAHDIEVGGFDSMCGIPLCLVPRSLAPFFALAELPPNANADADADADTGADGGEFVKPRGCESCVLQSRCFGLRRGYAELHGTAELRPVSHPDRSPDTPR
jgi:MoaA/NifB/PqqE/SkfB family radical SAM enzyme